MNTILCSDCGKLMSRYTTKCVRCTRENLEFYTNPNSPELHKRVLQLTGRRTFTSPFMRGLVVFIAAAIVTLGYWHYDQQFAVKMPAERPVQTAGTAAAITH